MKKTKIMISFVLLFMMVGIAAVATNVVVNLTTPIVSNPDDFLVYFSDVKVNGIQDLSLVRNEKQLVFVGEFTEVGDKKVISYDITNASQNYDAEILVNCTESTTYLNITNVFDTKTALNARSTRTGTLTIELSNAVTEEISQNVSCTIIANAVEKENFTNTEIPLPVQGLYPVGAEISIGDEKFNIVDTTIDTVTLLAQYPLGSNYRQDISTTMLTNIHDFNYYDIYEIDSSVKELDIQLYDEFLKIYVNEYVSYIKSISGDLTIKGDLISLIQLKELGCTITDDYSNNNNLSCYGSKNYSWLVKDFFWYTKSLSSSSGELWKVGLTGNNGKLYDNSYGWNNGASSIRPIIIISKEALEKNIISFTIDGIAYKAYEGMYWSEWVDSPFNTAGYVVEQDDCNFRVILPDHPAYIVNDDSMADSVIIVNKEYTSRSYGIWACNMS